MTIERELGSDDSLPLAWEVCYRMSVARPQCGGGEDDDERGRKCEFDVSCRGERTGRERKEAKEPLDR